MKDFITFSGIILAWCIFVFGGIFLLTACSGSVTTEVQGDRDVVMVTTGHLKNGSGDGKRFFIIRDNDTGVDYLAVIDAGIIKLEPKTPPKAEKE